MHLGDIDVGRRDAGQLVCLLGGQVGNRQLGLVGGALDADPYHAGQYLDGATAAVLQALQSRRIADYHRRRAVADRRTHLHRQRIGDGWRGQHLFYATGLAVLSQRIVHGVAVVLSGHRGDLMLGGAVAVHVVAADRGIHVHKDAIGTLRRAAGWRRDAGTQRDQRGAVLFGARNIPAGVEHREHPGLVRHMHFFRADRQRHVGAAGLDRLHRQVEGRRTGGAGIFHRVDRDAAQAAAAHGDRAGDAELALQLAGGGAGVEHGADVGLVAAGILEGQADSGIGQVVDAGVEHAAEGRHADADHVDIVHIQCFQVSGSAAAE